MITAKHSPGVTPFFERPLPARPAPFGDGDGLRNREADGGRRR